MKIKEIIFRSRRDFRAIYTCEHCGHEKVSSGYDDAYFHQTVIPRMECGKCGKVSPDNYKPRATKYSEHEVV